MKDQIKEIDDNINNIPMEILENKSLYELTKKMYLDNIFKKDIKIKEKD